MCVLLLQDLLQRCSSGGGGEWRTCDDDDPFIVLSETKFSSRCIPVWIGTLLTGLGSKKNTCDNVCVCLLLQDLLQSCYDHDLNGSLVTPLLLR